MSDSGSGNAGGGAWRNDPAFQPHAFDPLAQPELFRGIRWSGPDVLADTLERASRADLGVSVLRTMGDVDTVEDLAAEWDRVRPLLDAKTRDEIERTLRPI